jgi:hypothetical protein
MQASKQGISGEATVRVSFDDSGLARDLWSVEIAGVIFFEQFHNLPAGTEARLAGRRASFAALAARFSVQPLGCVVRLGTQWADMLQAQKPPFGGYRGVIGCSYLQVVDAKLVASIRVFMLVASGSVSECLVPGDLQTLRCT